MTSFFMFVILLALIVSKKCYKTSQCPPEYKDCGEDKKIEIKVCGPESLKLSKPQVKNEPFGGYDPYKILKYQYDGLQTNGAGTVSVTFEYKF